MTVGSKVSQDMPLDTTPRPRNEDKLTHNEDGGDTTPSDPPTDSSSLSLRSSEATSEEDVCSREDSDRSSSLPKKTHKVRFADTSVTSWGSTLQEGFLYGVDPFAVARRQCPRHILSSIDKNLKGPDTDLDEFGQVSKRALPEHYYANTGAIGGSSWARGERSRSPGRRRRDRHSADDLSHPRCFANPKNNIRLTTVHDAQTAGYLDTSLVSPRSTLQGSTSKMIRFAESGHGATSPHRHADSPANSSQRTAKSPSDSEGLFYGQRRPGVKAHSCLTDASRE